ncbi:MAG: PAS domain-containing protein, partial [Acidimicrobiales bacterium]|nr:PAS domain-containing protein [Acidimicrobiales bacterium]
MTALSRSSLVRFGAAIMAGSALLTGVSFLSAVRQGSALERRNDMAQMSALVKDADKYHDSLRALVYGSALDDLLGPEAAAALADEIPGSAQTFLDIVDEASALDVDSRISDALDAMRPVVERYGASSVGAAAALEALSSAGTTDGIDRDEARAAYDTWVSDFEELAVVLDDELAASVETVGAEIVDDAARAASTAKLLIALSALAAFGLFVAVGVRVLRAVTHMNELQAETERIGSMVENSPTNTMFCDTDLVVRYMNPASLQTLRSIEHLLPCRADDIVGRSIDIFHEDPAHQRRLLGDPDRFLPHSAEIRVGDEIMQLNASAIRDAHGTYIGAMATWSLITDRVRTQQLADAAQERERAAAAELASKVDALSATLAAAAAGDLTARVSVSGDDAIGRMGHAVEKLLGDLRTSIHAIAANSEALAAAAEELQAVAAQMGGNSADTSHQVAKVSDASIEVARYVETVSAASDQMSSSIKEIARNASEAAQVATQAVEAAKVTNQSVAALGESSLEIGQIVKV